MAYAISNLENDVIASLHGQTLNQIANIRGLENRAAQRLLGDLDPMETKRITSIAGTVFNGVWDYPAPADLKGNKIIDLYPQVNRYPTDMWLQAYNQDFDRKKGSPWSSDMFSILFNTGLKTVRINAPFLPPPTILDACTNAGTWTASGGATTPTVDNVNFVANGGSLLFNLSAGQSSGTLADALTAPIDLTNHLNQSTLFLWAYLPTPASVTSVNLKWGTNSANYYSVTTSVTQQATVFQTGWNLLAFPWLGATVVGTPTVSNINYVAVTFNYDTTLQTAVRLDYINSNLGSILNCEYYSKYLFRTSAGVFQETVTDTSNLINLDTDSYPLYFNLVMTLATQQQQGLDALFYDGNFFMQAYQEGLQMYKAKYKSEIQLPQSTYYKVKKQGYRMPGRWNY